MYDGASPSLYVSRHSLNCMVLDAQLDGKPVEATSQHVLNVVVLLVADE